MVIISNDDDIVTISAEEKAAKAQLLSRSTNVLVKRKVDITLLFLSFVLYFLSEMRIARDAFCYGIHS